MLRVPWSALVRYGCFAHGTTLHSALRDLDWHVETAMASMRQQQILHMRATAAEPTEIPLLNP